MVLKARTASVSAKISPEVKTRANEVLSKLGMTSSTAIQMFFTQIAENGRIPVETKLSEDQEMELELKNHDYIEVGNSIDDVKKFVDKL